MTKNAKHNLLLDLSTKLRTFLSKKLIISQANAISEGSIGQHATTNTIFYEHYLPISQFKHKTHKAREGAYVNHVEPYFGDRSIIDIKPVHVRQWKTNLLSQNLSAATINKLIIILGQIIDLAQELDIGGVLPRSKLGLELLKTPNNQDFFLNNEQLISLRKQCRLSNNHNLLHIVDLLVLTGARKREILDAKWQDMDFRLKLLRVPCSKNGKPRFITLCDQAYKIICELHILNVDNEYIVANPKTGRPYGCIYHAWDKARKAAGLPNVRIHDLRHSFASALVNSGVSLYEVQQLLGHASIKTTQRYAHLDQSRLQRSVESVSDFYK
jgi:integrase